ncbi:MAG: hypothetical protein KGH69_03030 [Candidatus Micrarchaeota archaeon]|nr:hypothetical protein [Candidatus Micrarchaeota archaeon]
MILEPKHARIFVSNALIGSAESRGDAAKRGPGRPPLHAECLILGILAAKSVFGLVTG